VPLPRATRGNIDVTTNIETHAALAGLHPLGRMGEVREVVEAVLYLESAAFVTGETLHVDGGAHAGHW
jgi:NAD(P)-dependent dehydrogenase (short-subunit alcohol dehydrogenase family)